MSNPQRYQRLVRHAETQEKEIACLRRENLFLRYGKDSEEVWHWMSEGGNYLGSLTCPILIEPGELQALLEQYARMSPSERQQFTGDEKVPATNKEDDNE